MNEKYKRIYETIWTAWSIKLVLVSWFLAQSFFVYAISSSSITSSYHWDCFLGSQFSQKDLGDHSYLQYHNFSLLLEKEVNPLQTWLELNYRQTLFAKELLLESAGASWQNASWQVAFFTDNIGYGNDFQAWTHHLKHPLFRQPLLGKMEFTGAQLGWLRPHSRLQARIGGNIYNSSIIDICETIHFPEMETKLFYLYTGRDNWFNQNMHSAGWEWKFQKSFFRLLHAATFQHFVEAERHPERRQMIQGTEIVLGSQAHEILLHYNCLYYYGNPSQKYHDEIRDYEFQSLFNQKHRWGNIQLGFRYQNAYNAFSREIFTSFNIEITQGFLLGGWIGYEMPHAGENQIVLGIQNQIFYPTF